MAITGKDQSEGVWGALLGGSWIVINGLISRVTILISHIRGLITPPITTREPPSRGLRMSRLPENHVMAWEHTGA